MVKHVILAHRSESVLFCFQLNSKPRMKEENERSKGPIPAIMVVVYPYQADTLEGDHILTVPKGKS